MDALAGVIKQTLGIATQQSGYIRHNATLHDLFVKKCECTPNTPPIEHSA
jgi:hypothetical protein